MNAAGTNSIEILVSARKVANFAAAEGVETDSRSVRPSCTHLGAILADSILQAGLNYKSVVRPRVMRIMSEFSHVDTTDSLLSIINSGATGSFFAWRHPTKICRFEELVVSIHEIGIRDSSDLRTHLGDDYFCEFLQSINGVGPKTVDYMSCLVGIESVAVDRHIRNYAKRVGVEATDYRFLKGVFCFAADFLEVSRREFDAWIWRRESGNIATQLSLNL
jgi:hypothetical protein